jgi:hypothetical protein
MIWFFLLGTTIGHPSISDTEMNNSRGQHEGSLWSTQRMPNIRVFHFWFRLMYKFNFLDYYGVYPKRMHKYMG